MVDAKASGRFKCTRCGWCCQNQLVSVSTVEIRAITHFINEIKTKQELEEHAVSCLSYEGGLEPYDFRVKIRLHEMRNFNVQAEVEFFEEKTALVRTHVLRLISNSMRCIFYNPLQSSCLIYPARPLTCRLFPYSLKNNKIIMVDETDTCPGAGQGEHVNLQRHIRLNTMCYQLLHYDDIIFWKYAAQKGLRWIRDANKQPHISTVTLIDPFLEIGQIQSTAIRKH
ncbi:MAG: Flagellin N-methylase [Thermoproteota archaeon]|nr:Flagellin N-methylase [Thermoproteota archaeon]